MENGRFDKSYIRNKLIGQGSFGRVLATIDEAKMISAIIPAKTDFMNSTVKMEKKMLYCESNSGFTFEKSSKNSRIKSIKNHK